MTATPTQQHENAHAAQAARDHIVHGLALLPDCAAFWIARGAIVVADVHLGKAASFRAAGVPVPETVAHDLSRLTTLLEAHHARELIVLGDLIHDRHAAKVEDAFRSWREHHASVYVRVVVGNHDKRATGLLGALGVELVSEGTVLDDICLLHNPDARATRTSPASSESPALAGHLHPAIRLHRGPGGCLGSERAPCFWLRAGTLVFPAFGSFTGGHAIRPAPGDRVWAVGEGRIVEVTPKPGA